MKLSNQVNPMNLLVLVLLLSLSASAQTLDRKIVPTPGKTPTLHVPTWSRATLASGAELIV